MAARAISEDNISMHFQQLSLFIFIRFYKLLIIAQRQRT